MQKVLSFSLICLLWHTDIYRARDTHVWIFSHISSISFLERLLWTKGHKRDLAVLRSDCTQSSVVADVTFSVVRWFLFWPRGHISSISRQLCATLVETEPKWVPMLSGVFLLCSLSGKFVARSCNIINLLSHHSFSVSRTSIQAASISRTVTDLQLSVCRPFAGGSLSASFFLYLSLLAFTKRDSGAYLHYAV